MDLMFVVMDKCTHYQNRTKVLSTALRHFYDGIEDQQEEWQTKGEADF
jgi:hypothetical protein